MFAPADPSAASTAKGFGAPSSTALERALEDTRLPTARGYEAPAPAGLPLAAAVALPPGAATRSPARAPVVLEVTPRGLGIGTVAGFCEELIRRNSRLPAAMKKLFTTSRDRQDVVRIVVCQGESRRMDNNVVIGDLVLQGLPPRPRGETSIEVTFSLDASGILQVHARDAQTGAEQRAALDLIGAIPQQDVAASRDRVQMLRR
jgi:molecular chaperone DnaK